MTIVNKCNLPEDLYYVVGKHVWARREGDLVTVGMTDVAQNMAKTIVAVTPKAAGKSVQKGRNIATVESGKWVGPVSAPISGEIVAVNDALAVSPSLVNSDPYGAGWVARLRPSDWESDVADLVTGPEGIEALPTVPRRRGDHLRVTPAEVGSARLSVMRCRPKATFPSTTIRSTNSGAPSKISAIVALTACNPSWRR